ncbi:MAG: shikimate kinase [Aphanocapsa sp. GSE-SYN-MK-11-07L]|nr:shikimate kinase [Aphanocapsa sp. GSE-SYN-MK-11-07L]
MMGTGKSTVGRLLSQELGYRFFDTDAVIEQAAGQSVSELFASHGEATFRQLETQVLAELSAYTDLIIATGGGIVLKRDNWSYLHQGIVVWLDVPVQELHKRLQQDCTRPLLQAKQAGGPTKELAEEFAEELLERLQILLTERRQLYSQADLRVSFVAGETPEQAASRILETLPQVLKPV